MNYIYGTWQVLRGLRALNLDMNQPWLLKARDWLESVQHEDGGWGERCNTYDDPVFKGQGPSTASQTAWAVMGLCAFDDPDRPSLRRGIEYLVRTQNPDGSWTEDETTGTGFPKVFYLKYDMYRNSLAAAGPGDLPEPSSGQSPRSAQPGALTPAAARRRVKRKLLIGLAALAACALAAMLIRGRSPNQFLYQGKSVRIWAAQLFSPTPRSCAEAEAAFKAMGPRAVPDLIRMLQAKDSFFRKTAWSLPRAVPQSLRRFVARNVSMPDAGFLHLSAAHALAVVGPDAHAAVPALAQALRASETGLRWEVANALGRIGEPSVRELINALADKDPELRQIAARALAAAGPSATNAIPALMQRLKDADENVRNAAAYAFSQIGSPAIPALLRMIEREHGLTRQIAARALIPLSPPRRLAAPALLQMLQDDDLASRRQAIETLGAIRAADPAVITAVTAALNHNDPQLRLAAAVALGELSWKAQAAVPALIQALRDDSPAVRQAAASTLGKIGPPASSAIPELTRLAQDKYQTVRAAAKEARQRIAPPASPNQK